MRRKFKIVEVHPALEFFDDICDYASGSLSSFVGALIVIGLIIGIFFAIPMIISDKLVEFFNLQSLDSYKLLIEGASSTHLKIIEGFMYNLVKSLTFIEFVFVIWYIRNFFDEELSIKFVLISQIIGIIIACMISYFQVRDYTEDYVKTLPNIIQNESLYVSDNKNADDYDSLPNQISPDQNQTIKYKKLSKDTGNIYIKSKINDDQLVITINNKLHESKEKNLYFNIEKVKFNKKNLPVQGKKIIVRAILHGEE